ncbi:MULTISPECIES: response regulator transcription factor [Sulfitobacter]|uniref:helix-turn-helix transcriptional regulator n=1 Tax=Sulfitobacter TaxID=60136 RepID=UPI00230803CA|nr:response regulator transcription factor [Sulfitobacter faviae]WCE68594.1 response regulator transcription factor [Sulfitobacter faviae]
MHDGVKLKYTRIAVFANSSLDRLAIERLCTGEGGKISASRLFSPDCASSVYRRREEIDLVIVSIEAIDALQLKCLSMIISIFDKAPIVVFSADVDNLGAFTRFNRSIKAVIPNTVDPDTARALLKVALLGYSIRINDQLFAIAQPYISHDDIGKLTPREREVARKVGEGLVNKDIARQLSISLNTVNVHLQAIRRKLGLKNRTAAALALSQSNFAVEPKLTTALPPTKNLYRSKSQDERGSTSMRPIIQ